MATRGAPLTPVRNANGAANHACSPIAAISPYASKNFRIKGVVTGKEDMRTVTVRGAASKVFNFDVTDDKQSTIKCVAFGEVAERIYPVVQENIMLSIAGGTVRPANKKFNTTGHEYELSLNAYSEVTPLKDVPVIVVSFDLKNRVKLNELPKKVGQNVDVLACIDKVNPATEFTSKANGTSYTKREISLIDQTGVNINFVLWSEHAKNFPEHTEGQPMGIRGAMVKEFNGGLSLGATASTKYVLTPEGIDGMSEMCEWYIKERGTVQTQSLSVGVASEGALGRDLRLLGTASALQLGKGEQVYMSVKARITNIKGESAIYKACPSANCSKKVAEQDDQYRCDKCNITGDGFKMAYMLQMEIADETGQVWLTMFGKSAEQFMGMSPDALGEIKNDNPSEYEAIFERLKFATRVFKLRAKAETYNNEERIRYTGFSADQPDYDKLNTLFDGVIERLNALPVC